MVWKTPIFGCMERMDICCCSCFVGPLFAGTFFLENISNIFCIFTLNKNFNKNFSEKCRIHRWKSGALVYGKFYPMWSRYSSEYDQKEAWYWRISCYGYCLLHVSQHITLSPLCHRCDIAPACRSMISQRCQNHPNLSTIFLHDIFDGIRKISFWHWNEHDFYNGIIIS